MRSGSPRCAARRFVSAELGPLAGGDESTARLAETLAVYLEERSSPKRAATRLGVHENTISNRIRTAQTLLERPIDERVPELLVALRLRSALEPAD
jgi:DNA-binding PucR family transcriptional regulator